MKNAAAAIAFLYLATVVGAQLGTDYVDEVPPTVYEAEMMSPQNMDFDKEVSGMRFLVGGSQVLMVVSYDLHNIFLRFSSLINKEQHVYRTCRMVQRCGDSLL